MIESTLFAVTCLELNMHGGRNLGAALLSLVWPGLGQLAQGRLVKGFLFLGWTSIGAAVFAFGSLSLGYQFVVAAEVLVVGVWAIVDAYRLPFAMDDRATC